MIGSYPEAIRVRRAEAKDVAALAALHVQTFNETHCSGRPDGPSVTVREQQWTGLFQQPNPSWFCVVAETDSKVLVGFAKGQPYSEGAPKHSAELNKIYVLQAYQGQGVGRLLFCEVVRQFKKRGLHSMLLFGDAASRSNGFYEAFRGEKLVTPKGEFHGAYGWTDLSIVDGLCVRLRV